MYGEDSGIKGATRRGIWSRWRILCFELYTRVIGESWEGLLSESKVLKAWSKHYTIIIEEIEASSPGYVTNRV
jgi:hypothetical protein